MADQSAESILYFALTEDDDADDDSGQQGRSGGTDRMRIIEIRCYPRPGPLAADGHVRWVLKRTVVPVPSSDVRWILERVAVPVPSTDVSHVLGDAVDNYVAAKISDPAFAFSDTWWIVSDPGALGASAQAVDGAQKGLHQLLLGNSAQAVWQGFGGSGQVPGMIGGIAAELPLPIDRPLVFIKTLLEVAGMIFGAAAGIPVLTTACCKLFLHDKITRTLARAIPAVIHDVLNPAVSQPSLRATQLSPSGQGRSGQGRSGHGVVGGEQSIPRANPRTQPKDPDLIDRIRARDLGLEQQGRPHHSGGTSVSK
jgi:hypothetical protein